MSQCSSSDGTAQKKSIQKIVGSSLNIHFYDDDDKKNGLVVAYEYGIYRLKYTTKSINNLNQMDRQL